MRIGGIGLDWTHPDVDKLDIRPSMSVMHCDGLIIDAVTWFEQIATQILGDVLWDTQGFPETNYIRGTALKSVIDEFKSQILELCAHGGVVVVLADNTAIVRYLLDDSRVQRMNALLNMPSNYSYLTSMSAFFGDFMSQRGGTRWLQTPRTGSGSPFIVKRTLWNEYLNESVEWRVILTLPESFAPIATAPVRGMPSEDIIAAASGSMAILPFPRDEDACDALVDCVKSFLSGRIRPEWASSVPIPAIQPLQEEIARYQNRITKLEHAIAGLEQFKDLLFETGDPLENIVGAAFEVLGLNPRKPKNTGDEDWLIDLPEGILAVCEVTGTDGIIPKKKATQLLDWKRRYDNCKAVLVVNPLRLEDPNDKFNRQIDDLISPHAVQICRDSGMSILFTQTLFEAVCKQLSGEDSGTELGSIVIQTNGVVPI